MPKFQGSIFDVDGVLVDSPHEKAWRESLRELMESSWRGIRDRMGRVADDVAGDSYRRGLGGGHRSSQNWLRSCMRSCVPAGEAARSG